MAVYFLYKIARGDFRYWLSLSGILGWIMSILSNEGHNRFHSRSSIQRTVRTWRYVLVVQHYSV